MTSTKKDIIRDVAAKTGFDIAEVKVIVQAMFDAMCEGLAKDNNIEIRNFGIFKVKYTPERKARNPRTSEIITVPPKRHISFKPGLQMKLRINQDLLGPNVMPTGAGWEDADYEEDDHDDADEEPRETREGRDGM